MVFRRSRLLGSLLAVIFLLSACGGGGGGGGGPANHGSFSVSTNSLTFIASGPTASTPAAQPISGTVAGVSSGTLYIIVTGSGPAVASISSVNLTSQTTGQAFVSVPPPSTLGIGTHTGTITVRACLNDPNCTSGALGGSPQTINVTYHVAALLSSSASLNYSITNTPASGDLTRQTTISGFPEQSWTAGANADWLTVTASGQTGSALNAALNQTVIDGMVNGTYKANVTLTAGTAGNPLVIPVTLELKRTQINYVAPYVAYAGTSQSVSIRGEEFNQLSIQGVQFGSVAATAFTIVSPTEIRATYPVGLALGRHAVRLTGAASVRTLAELAVIAPQVFTAAVIPYTNIRPRTPITAVYDAERGALGIAVGYQDSTAFLRFLSSDWANPVAVPKFNVYNATLSMDGAEWILGADKSIVHLDANNLTTRATVPSLLFGSGTQRITRVALANNGQAAVLGDESFGCGPQLMYYNVRARAFSNGTLTSCRGDLGGSADGSRIVIGGLGFLVSDAQPVYLYDASLNTQTPTTLQKPMQGQPVSDQSGTRWVLNKTEVYNGSFAFLGNLPPIPPYQYNGTNRERVILSPSGDRAYTYSTTNGLHVYNLNSALVNGIYPEITPAPTLAGNPGDSVQMAMTPDGRTLFLAGQDAIVIVPVQ